MKTTIIISAIIFISNLGMSQDAMEIIKKSQDKCISIDHGYYEMTERMKYMSGNDTSEVKYKSYFKKWDKKTPFPVLFQTRSYYKGEAGWVALFTGEELVTFSPKDSTGTIKTMAQWEEEIEASNHNYELYNPFTHRTASPFPDEESLKDTAFHARYLGEAMIGDKVCYHIQTIEPVENEPGSPMVGLDFVSHIWIDPSDWVPVRYERIFTMVMNKDTMVQYERFTLDQYDLTSPWKEDVISMQSIPPYIQLKDYTPYKHPDPLPVDTIAPGWSFPSLKDEIISLESLKGKLVLIDFFYKSCFPCMQALPALQSLHEKYKDQGLVVIGLDPYDTKEDNMETFLAKRDVDYNVLYASKEIAKTYRVSGYPTMFLIDKAGKIIAVQEGYGEGVEKELEEIIVKNL